MENLRENWLYYINERGNNFIVFLMLNKTYKNNISYVYMNNNRAHFQEFL